MGAPPKKDRNVHFSYKRSHGYLQHVAAILTFAKYHNIDTGETEIKFLHTDNLLSESEETSTDAKSVFESLKNLIQNQLQFDLADLKAFVSDGASAMTVKKKVSRQDFAKQKNPVQC